MGKLEEIDLPGYDANYVYGTHAQIDSKIDALNRITGPWRTGIMHTQTIPPGGGIGRLVLPPAMPDDIRLKAKNAAQAVIDEMKQVFGKKY